MSPRVRSCCMALTGIAVVLHVEHAQLALHHVQIGLIPRELCAQAGEFLAPGLLALSAASLQPAASAAPASPSLGAFAAPDGRNPAGGGQIVVVEDLGRLSAASFFASRALRAASASESCCGAGGCAVLVLVPWTPAPGSANCPAACWHQPPAAIARIAAAAAQDRILRMATPPGTRSEPRPLPV